MKEKSVDEVVASYIIRDCSGETSDGEIAGIDVKETAIVNIYKSGKTDVLCRCNSEGKCRASSERPGDCSYSISK